MAGPPTVHERNSSELEKQNIVAAANFCEICKNMPPLCKHTSQQYALELFRDKECLGLKAFIFIYILIQEHWTICVHIQKYFVCTIHAYMCCCTTLMYGTRMSRTLKGQYDEIVDILVGLIKLLVYSP